MNADRPAVPAEPEALERPWRRWASIGVIGFVVVSAILGFWLVPGTADERFDPLAAICRSIGIPGFQQRDGLPVAEPPPKLASNVSWTADTRELLANASVEEGKSIAASICVACHGTDGIGIMPSYPNLTHQSAAAIFKQLNDYKTGVRAGGMAAVMTPMVVGLSEQQMADVAAYYASLPARVTEFPKRVSREVFQLIKIGSPARALPPCDSCHGVNMSGPEESPVLLGQSPEYFEQQLNLFKSGERSNDNFARMRIIARALTPEEIKQLAQYYAPPSR